MKKPLVTIIKRSCLTGKAVWVYQGKSLNAARKAYWVARKKEIERVKNWPKTAEAYTAYIRNFINSLLEKIPINCELTPDQREAIRELKALEKKGIECDLEFYNHIMEERRRREEDREIRRQMREREELEKREKNENNNRYDK